MTDKKFVFLQRCIAVIEYNLDSAKPLAVLEKEKGGVLDRDEQVPAVIVIGEISFFMPEYPAQAFTLNSLECKTLLNEINEMQRKPWIIAAGELYDNI